MSAFACAKGRNSRLISARVSPMPLSVTVKIELSLAARGARRAHVEPHRAVLGEFHRVVDQIFERGAQPHRIADQHAPAGRRRSSTSHGEAFGLRARRERCPPARRPGARGRNTCCCSVSAPASALGGVDRQAWSARRDARRRSLMPAAQRRSRSPRLELASNSPSARMPVSAVRMSCANAASAASVGAECRPTRRRWRAVRSRPLGRGLLASLRSSVATMARPGAARTMATASRPGPKHEASGTQPLNGQRHATIRRLAAEPDHAPDIRAALRRRRATRAGSVACGRFRQLAAVVVEDQPVMMIDRLRQTEQRLQQAMDAGRPEQILSAHHVA